MKFIGSNGSKYLFVEEDRGVIIDDSKNIVVNIGDKDALVASLKWGKTDDSYMDVAVELATASMTSLDINVLSTNERLYTVPNSIASEAKRGMNWNKDRGRGGSPVGTNTAALLASGGQIDIKKIRHIAKYFPRHEEDRYKTGFSSSEENYPSDGRIGWALWGGDSARSWATTIINKENKIDQKNAITASFEYIMSDYDTPNRAQLSPFEDADNLSVDLAPQFYIRIRLDSNSIDRLYMVNPDGACFVWDDAMWEDLGNVNHDFDTYDRSLDDASDQSEKIHVPVDVESAVAISARIDMKPFDSISVEDIAPEESQMFMDDIYGIDWGQIDSVYRDKSLLAAGDTAPAPAAAPTAKTDGNYTPEERSANAGQQVRDKAGKFAKQGGTVVVGGNPAYKGVITSINPSNQSVKLKLANGSFVDVPANLTEDAKTFVPIPTGVTSNSKNIAAGILGTRKTATDSSVASLPAGSSQLTKDQVGTIVGDYPLWTGQLRKSASSNDLSEGGKYTKEGKYFTPNAYNDPRLRDFLNKKVVNSDGTVSYPNAHWYRPDLIGADASRIQDYQKKIKPVPNYSDQSKPSFGKPGKNFSIGSDSVAVLAAAAGTKLTPVNSDVPPLYMAIVAADDPQAVMDLVALIPASTESTVSATYTRKPGAWVENPSILTDLNSATPPPVVVLDDDTLKIVKDQIDSAKPTTASVVTAILSGGGLDRNKGNAEKLRRYWLHGEGAAKILWKTPGDWTRCVRHLSKFMGTRAKGYCALRHKEATGMWTGDKEHVQSGGYNKAGKKMFSTDYLSPEVAIIATAELKVKAAQARSRVNGIPVTPTDPAEHGAAFTIPLVIPEGVESGDGRSFAKGSITMRELPLPLLWQMQTADGHSGSVIVGKIVSMERTEQGIGNAKGFFDSGVSGKEAERLVRGGFLRGVSADMDMFEADEEPEENTDKNVENDPDKKVGGGKMNITKARVMAATLVPKPAFQECGIELVGSDPTGQEESEVITDGIYVDGVNSVDASALVACGLIAGVIPVTPPTEWFDNPKLSGPTPLTVDDDGRVYGHVAAWHVDHIGLAFGTKPPKSRSGYAYFHTGVVRTDSGTDIPVGQLTLAGGHASLEASASEAVRHYDDTASAVADVHAGEDAYGIWVSGALRPGTQPEQIRALRASAPSGDWRPIRGGLELVAVLQVNTPGFPIARARVASGQVMALVAAGAMVLAQMKSDPIAELNQRLDNLELPIVSGALSAKNRVSAVTASIRAGELSARVKDARDTDSFYMLQTITDDDNETAIINRESRQRLASQGKALPNGSFPIRNAGDLKNAVHAYGRAKPGQRGLVKRHIMKMARKLGKTDLIPAAWKSSGNFSLDELSEDLRLRTSKAMVSAGIPEPTPVGEAPRASDIPDLTPEEREGLTEDEIDILEREIKDKRRSVVDGRVKFTPDTQPRDTSGKFRQVLARLKVDLGDVGSQEAVDKIGEAEELDNAGNYGASVKAAADLIDIIDRLDTGALDNISLENVRSSAKELGSVIANLPFAFGQDAQKIRYSDVPPVLRDLIEDMISRVEAKIGQEDADIATDDLRHFMSGGDYYSQSEISSQMAKLLRLLT